MPLPPDLAQSTASESPEAVAAFRAQWDEQLREMLTAQAAPLFCQAVAGYQHILTIDPGSARARAQLAAYGDDFVRSCGF